MYLNHVDFFCTIVQVVPQLDHNDRDNIKLLIDSFLCVWKFFLFLLFFRRVKTVPGPKLFSMVFLAHKNIAMARSCWKKHCLGAGAKCCVLFDKLHPRSSLLAHIPKSDPQKKVDSLVATTWTPWHARVELIKLYFFCSKNFLTRSFIVLCNIVMSSNKALKMICLKNCFHQLYLQHLQMKLRIMMLNKTSTQLFLHWGTKLKVLTLLGIKGSK